MKALGYVVAVGLALAVVPVHGAIPSVPFKVGERLSYRIFWGPVLVGEATLLVRNIEPVDGHDCYHLEADARTVGIGRLLFAMDCATESWLDMTNLFTRRYRQNRVEGTHEKHSETDYDYDRQEAVTRNLKTGREKRMRLDQPVQDMISSLYYVRAQPLAVNDQRTFIVNASDTNYSVTIRPDERRSLTLRPVGEVPALRIEPSPTLQFVAANHGRMWFWISDDARRLPLTVTSTMSIGSAKLVLYKIESGATGPFSAPNFVAAAR